MSKRNKTRNNINIFKKIIVILVPICLLGKCGFDIYRGNDMRRQLKYGAKKTDTAIVINEIHRLPNGHISDEQTYMYSFKLGSKEYKGICTDKKYRPGDKIFIDYVIENPEYNQPHNYYSSDDD